MGSELIKQAGTLISGQDWLFWLAAAAVAAGLTILVVTGYLYLRDRRRARKPRVRRASPGTISASPAAPAALNRARLDAYRSTGGSPADDSGRGELLARLRKTADNLANLRDELRRAHAGQGESPLKDRAPAVEYVFRKGVG